MGEMILVRDERSCYLTLKKRYIFCASGHHTSKPTTLVLLDQSVPLAGSVSEGELSLAGCG
jgi:hypothetical protein